MRPGPPASGSRRTRSSRSSCPATSASTRRRGEAVGTLIGQAQIKLAKFTVVETRDVEIEGATTAQVVRYTITDNANSQLAGEWIVAAHWPYPQSVAVSILTPQHDPDLERAVLDSMRMRPDLG